MWDTVWGELRFLPAGVQIIQFRTPALRVAVRYRYYTEKKKDV